MAVALLLLLLDGGSRTTCTLQTAAVSWSAWLLCVCMCVHAQPGAVDVFLDFISYSAGPLPEQLLEKVRQQNGDTPAGRPAWTAQGAAVLAVCGDDDSTVCRAGQMMEHQELSC